MNNFWTQIKRPARHASKALQARPFLALAPIAGISDQPFRLICKEFGADVLYSEMISSEAIWHKKCKIQSAKFKVKESLRDDLYKTLKLIQFSEMERPYVVQIFGADPAHMAYAAEYIACGEWNKDYFKITSSNKQAPNKFQFPKSKSQNNLELGVCNLEFASIPDGIDVNMGCPARDVTKTGAGAALLKNPKLAEKIIKAIKKKVKNIPVSVKTRIGWNDNKNILTFLRILECAGVDAIAIHGRTVKQGFSGKVDYETIYKVKKALKIPVIGNGGITYNSQLTTQQRELDGIMIGQGALGRPWVFEKLKKQLNSHREESLWDDATISSDISRDCFAVARNDIKKTVLKHAKLVQELKGEPGMIEFRKHLGWYFKGTINAKQIRSQLVKVNTIYNIKKIIKDLG